MADRPARLVREVQIPGLAPPVSHYADATVLGDQLFVSGLLALDAERRLVGAGDAALQAEHIFTTLERILHAVGSDLGDVAKLTVFVTDLDHRVALDNVRKKFFGDFRPASTLVAVAGLIGDGTLVEIDAIAGVRPTLERQD